MSRPISEQASSIAIELRRLADRADVIAKEADREYLLDSLECQIHILSSFQERALKIMNFIMKSNDIDKVKKDIEELLEDWPNDLSQPTKMDMERARGT